MRLKLHFITLFLLHLVAIVSSPKYQTIYGFNGLLSVPSANLLDENKFTLGCSFINKNAASYSNYNYHNMVTYMTLGFLSFSEISLKLTRNIDYPHPQALGDRAFTIRIKLLKNSDYLPTIAVGYHDITTVSNSKSKHFNSINIVASKNIYLLNPKQKLEIVLGYGFDFMKASEHQFRGFFGGISFNIPFNMINYLDLQGLLEYDAKEFNSGINIRIIKKIKLLLGSINMKYLTCSLSYTMLL